MTSGYSFSQTGFGLRNDGKKNFCRYIFFLSLDQKFHSNVEETKWLQYKALPTADHRHLAYITILLDRKRWIQWTMNLMQWLHTKERISMNQLKGNKNPTKKCCKAHFLIDFSLPFGFTFFVHELLSSEMMTMTVLCSLV